MPNERGMYLLRDDPEECASYRGQFQGTTVFLVGLGTDQERIFFRKDRVASQAFARDNKLSWTHVSVTSLCHDRMVALMGA